MSITNETVFSNFIRIPKYNISPTTIQAQPVAVPPKKENDIILPALITTGTTALGAGIGYKSYCGDKLELQSSLTRAQTEVQTSFIQVFKDVIEKLQVKFSDLIVMSKEGKKVVVPNGIMVEGPDPQVTKELIEWTGKNSNCTFVQIKHTDSLLKKLKEAEARFKGNGNRTLIHVEGFEILIDPKQTTSNIIAGCKSIMSAASDNYHSTLIFDTKDASKLDNAATGPHRVKKIDVEIPLDYEKYKLSANKVKDFAEKLKHLTKFKVIAGTVLGLAAGVIVTMVANSSVFSKDK